MVRKVGWRAATALVAAGALVALSSLGAGAYTGTGGGYTVIDSEETAGNPPPFAWDDPTSHPLVTMTPNSSYDALDEGYGTLAIPWSFTFMGTGYTTVYVSSNGYLQFGAVPAAFDFDSAIPSTFVPNNVVATMWGDLDGSTVSAVGGSIRSQVLGTTGNRRLVISWVNFDFYFGSAVMTFQVALYEAGGANSIRVQYQTMTGGGSDGTNSPVGFQNAAGAGAAYGNPAFTTPPAVVPPGNTIYGGLAIGYFPTGSTPGWAAPPPPPPPPPPGGGGSTNNSDDDDDSRFREIKREMCNSAASAHAGLASLAVAMAALVLLARRR